MLETSLPLIYRGDHKERDHLYQFLNTINSVPPAQSAGNSNASPAGEELSYTETTHQHRATSSQKMLSVSRRHSVPNNCLSARQAPKGSRRAN